MNEKTIGIEFGNTYLAPSIDYPRAELEDVIGSSKMAYGLSDNKSYNYIGWMLIDDLHGLGDREEFIEKLLEEISSYSNCKVPDFYVLESELIPSAKNLIKEIPEVTSNDLSSSGDIVGRMGTKTGMKLYVPKFTRGYYKTKLEEANGVPTCPLLSATFHTAKLGGVDVLFHPITGKSNPVADFNLTILPSKYKGVEAEAKSIMKVLAQVKPKYKRCLEGTHHIFVDPDSWDCINPSLDEILGKMGV